MPSAKTRSAKPVRNLYDLLTGDEDARVCLDIPDSACHHQPRNFIIHLVALAATKSADLLVSPKLVLPWLLGALGAPAYLTGMLVPIRESLALLPQLLVASVMRACAERKGFWIAGSLIQGGCIAGMAAIAWLGLEGNTAGWAVLALLAVFSLGRGLCSVAAKDVIGKTVSKTRRGMLSGYAATVAGFSAMALGLYVLLNNASALPSLIALLAGAGLLWLLAAGVFGTLQETPGATSGGGNAASEAVKSLSLLRSDAHLRDFIIARSLLISSALVAPFYILLAQQHTNSAVGLGVLLLASGLANTSSAAFWGRFADRSSRRVLTAAGCLAAVTSLTTAFLPNMPIAPSLAPYAYGAAFLLLSVAHSGVRLGRKTYLVDLANADNRAAYVALSNTLIGLVLLIAGAIISLLSLTISTPSVIMIMAGGALAGALYALRLPEVQTR